MKKIYTVIAALSLTLAVSIGGLAQNRRRTAVTNRRPLVATTLGRGAQSNVRNRSRRNSAIGAGGAGVYLKSKPRGSAMLRRKHRRNRHR